MTTEEILKSLCYYDKRNPDCMADDDRIESKRNSRGGRSCYCDNCFSGRTELATELLKFIMICAIQ